MSLRMDAELKKQAEELFSRDTPNRDTLEAMEEIKCLENDPNKKVYDTFEDFMRDMENEI